MSSCWDIYLWHGKFQHAGFVTWAITAVPHAEKNSLDVFNWVHATQILLNMEGKIVCRWDSLFSVTLFFPIWTIYAPWVVQFGMLYELTKLSDLSIKFKKMSTKYFLCLYLYVFTLLDQYLGIFIYFKK